MRGKVVLTEGFDTVTKELEKMRTPRRERPRWGFVVLILALVAICVTLGSWQVFRLGQKQAEIARIEDRVVQPERALPPANEWVGFDISVWDYRRTSVTGVYRADQTILVFTNLTEARGKEKGPGYWVVTPIVLTDGGVVYINRGFIPEALRQVFADGGPLESGEHTVSGIVRRPEIANAFTPGAERADRIDWIRDPARFAAISDTDLAPVLPATIDADSQDGLPQGGETRLTLPNRHFEYAVTWFSLAAVALFMLSIWLFARRKS